MDYPQRQTYNHKSDSDNLFRPTRGVAAPVLISVFTFASFTVVVWSILDLLYVTNAFQIATVIGLVFSLLVWIFYLFLWFTSVKESFLPRLEKATGIDINRDGEIGKPQEKKYGEPQRLSMPTVTKGGSYQVNYIDIPSWLDREKFREVARRAVNGEPFSEPELVRGSKKIYTYNQWRDLRDDFLLEKDLVEWVNPDNHNDGVEWTEKGEDFCARVAEYGIPTPPPQD